MLKKIIFICIISFVSPLHATEYQSSKDFIRQIFGEEIPKPKVIWIKKPLRQQVATILQHKPGFLRTRYWQINDQTVWIINEIGKTKPITIAIAIKDSKITLLKVLSFRESRGWEVKHAFFTDQFKQNTLNEDLTLSNRIDGISGATLSVRALTKAAKLALLFNNLVNK